MIQIKRKIKFNLEKLFFLFYFKDFCADVKAEKNVNRIFKASRSLPPMSTARQSQVISCGFALFAVFSFATYATTIRFEACKRIKVVSYKESLIKVTTVSINSLFG